MHVAGDGAADLGLGSGNGGCLVFGAEAEAGLALTSGAESGGA